MVAEHVQAFGPSALDDYGLTGPLPKLARRGTSNGNSSGNSEDRRRRRAWLLETYRADVDVYNGLITVTYWQDRDGVLVCQLGEGIPACRCYRCGCLLMIETLTVDRIIPGCQGGTYRRNNIRPACSDCNSETGGRTRRKAKR